MKKKCLKCGFEGQGLESAPQDECPKCGAIYDKVEESLGLKEKKFTIGRVEKTTTEAVDFGNVLAAVSLVVIGVSLYSFFSSSDGGSVKHESQASIAIENAQCKQSLKCWVDKYFASAEVFCKDPIEKLAKYDIKWGDSGFLERKFTHYRWLDQSRGTITFAGDKIKFQNGFGAWQNSKYECDFDPTTETVLNVRANAGYL